MVVILDKEKSNARVKIANCTSDNVYDAFGFAEKQLKSKNVQIVNVHMNKFDDGIDLLEYFHTTYPDEIVKRTTELTYSNSDTLDGLYLRNQKKTKKTIDEIYSREHLFEFDEINPFSRSNISNIVELCNGDEKFYYGENNAITDFTVMDETVKDIWWLNDVHTYFDILRGDNDHIHGVSDSMIYFGGPGTGSSGHGEGLWLKSCNFNMKGSGKKMWLTIDAKPFLELNDFIPGCNNKTGCHWPILHKNHIMDIEMLADRNVVYDIVVQGENDWIFTSERAVHQVWNIGNTLSIAKNWATPDWHCIARVLPRCTCPLHPGWRWAWCALHNGEFEMQRTVKLRNPPASILHQIEQNLRVDTVANFNEQADNRVVSNDKVVDCIVLDEIEKENDENGASKSDDENYHDYDDVVPTFSKSSRISNSQRQHILTSPVPTVDTDSLMRQVGEILSQNTVIVDEIDEEPLDIFDSSELNGSLGEFSKINEIIKTNETGQSVCTPSILEHGESNQLNEFLATQFENGAPELINSYEFDVDGIHNTDMNFEKPMDQLLDVTVDSAHSDISIIPDADETIRGPNHIEDFLLFESNSAESVEIRQKSPPFRTSTPVQQNSIDRQPEVQADNDFDYHDEIPHETLHERDEETNEFVNNTNLQNDIQEQEQQRSDEEESQKDDEEESQKDDEEESQKDDEEESQKDDEEESQKDDEEDQRKTLPTRGLKKVRQTVKQQKPVGKSSKSAPLKKTKNANESVKPSSSKKSSTKKATSLKKEKNAKTVFVIDENGASVTTPDGRKTRVHGLEDDLYVAEMNELGATFERSEYRSNYQMKSKKEKHNRPQDKTLKALGNYKSSARNTIRENTAKLNGSNDEHERQKLEASIAKTKEHLKELDDRHILLKICFKLWPEEAVNNRKELEQYPPLEIIRQFISVRNANERAKFWLCVNNHLKCLKRRTKKTVLPEEFEKSIQIWRGALAIDKTVRIPRDDPPKFIAKRQRSNGKYDSSDSDESDSETRKNKKNEKKREMEPIKKRTKLVKS